MKSGYLLVLLSGLLSAPAAYATDSKPLTDNVGTKGQGVIDLFKNAASTDLEAHRGENGGSLNFGFKINENYKGTENSKSKGVTLKDAVLTLDFSDGHEKIYSILNGACHTETYSLLTAVGESSRNPSYTLIGSDDNNRGGTENAVQKTYDSTLKCNVPDKLDDSGKNIHVVKATLNVQFKQMDTSKGDPESFYDYSGAPETVALLNAADTHFIDQYQSGGQQAPAKEATTPTPAVDPLAVKSWNYFPSANTYYIVAYEDLYPSQGDYDFNDLVVAYQVQYGLNSNNQVVKVAGTAYLLAKGAAYSHDWHLRIGLPSTVKTSGTCSTSLAATPQTSFACNGANTITSSGTADVLMFADTGTLFPNTQFTDYRKVLANTLFGSAYLKGPKSTFSISLDQPVDAKTIAAAPFDPYLYVRNTKQKIQLLQVNPAVKDANGYPFGMLMPSGWKWAYEKTDIRTTYANLINFVATSGANSANWYNSPAKNQYFPSPQPSAWAW